MVDIWKKFQLVPNGSSKTSSAPMASTCTLQHVTAVPAQNRSVCQQSLCRLQLEGSHCRRAVRRHHRNPAFVGIIDAGLGAEARSAQHRATSTCTKKRSDNGHGTGLQNHLTRHSGFNNFKDVNPSFHGQTSSAKHIHKLLWDGCIQSSYLPFTKPTKFDLQEGCFCTAST